MTVPRDGAEAFCDVLEQEGVQCVFGLPGTQTVGLYDALRRSALRAVVPTHELGAAFMAYGHARASGEVGVLLTIPGPGFAFVTAGLAEASLDGVPVVHFTLTPARGPTGAPAFQALDQAAIARPLVKAVLRAETRDELPDVVRAALRLARAADPGPVFVEMTESALRATGVAVPRTTAGDRASVAAATSPGGTIPPATTAETDAAVARILAAERPMVLLAGAPAANAARLARIASTGRLPVVVPPPSRGAMPEDHPWMLCADEQRTPFETIGAAIALADLVVVLGTRLTHGATSGFRLRLPAEQVICCSESGESLPHGYRASVTLRMPVSELLARLDAESARFASAWSGPELSQWRARFASVHPPEPPEPVVNGGDAASFFSAVRAALPRDAIVLTDSGLHQALTRRHFTVLSAPGLVFPAELQSMAFGLPAAIGAKLAQRERVVLVVLGDGGFAMSGLELLTAAREEVPVIVVVFNDGKLNLIRLQQLREYGVAHGTDLAGPDLARFAEAVGVAYRNAEEGTERVIREAIASGRPTLIEVNVHDSTAIRIRAAKAFAKETARRAVGPNVFDWIKRTLR